MIFSLEQDFSLPEMVNPTVPHMRQSYAGSAYKDHGQSGSHSFGFRMNCHIVVKTCFGITNCFIYKSYARLTFTESREKSLERLAS